MGNLLFVSQTRLPAVDRGMWSAPSMDCALNVTVQLRQAAWGGIQGLLLKRSVSAVMAGMSFLRVVER